MDFRPLSPFAAIDWHLAHSIVVGGKRLPKGSLITRACADAIAGEGITEIQAYRLGEDDIGENEIADQIATLISGENTTASGATRGRVDLRASKAGIISIPRNFEEINRIDEGLTVATLKRDVGVGIGDLIATIKIIPYGLPRHVIDSVKSSCSALSIQPYKPYNIAVINSDTSQTSGAITQRIENTSGKLLEKIQSDHSTHSLKNAIQQCAINPAIDLILLVGKSAIADRRDTVPSSLEAANGKVLHLGMPADPGNLLMLGEINKKQVIGVPSCAKSPARNGFDMVLEEFAANRSLSVDYIKQAGIGGLLKPQAKNTKDRTRDTQKSTIRENDKGAAILLAAGASSRAPINKLLAKINGQTVASISAQNLADAITLNSRNIAVVTGRDAVDVEQSIGLNDVDFVCNTAFEAGISTSLKMGLERIAVDIELVLVALADMPFIKPATIDTLFIMAKEMPDRDIFVPTFNGKRGNPVLWRKSIFDDLKALEGDMGGKQLMKKYADRVHLVPVDDPGVLIDLDTQEALAQFGAL
jgi:molybdenum cofactor cytidylyltransferase